MKSPELTQSEGKKIDEYLAKDTNAKKLIETILFGDHRTLKEILKL